ncbi:MAG: ACP S-malonyltransferase [Rhodobiaceae bacterium]|jgi:[acyl-carrier-protein] S-malonyltransferase|nr:ACP S-malonyltransferase [Rhodobiaceae bacterium]MBT6222427.1 ACP S-malonyltransferase [Rhodobiaceae bacterium]
MSILYVFPGQGSQVIGMGKLFAESFKVSKDVFDEVDEALSEKLSKLIWEGSQDELTMTKNAQPALMTVSIAILRAIEFERGLDLSKIKYVAGHSLGEYSALAATEVFSLSDTAKLLRLRGESMQRSTAIGEGAMAALLGTTFNQAENLVNKVNSLSKGLVCSIANDNAPGQIVISGHRVAIELAAENAKEFGAKKAVLLPVSAPFHCSLMNNAANEMKDALSVIDMRPPKVPIITNVTAKEEVDIEVIRSLLVDQVTSMVRWSESITYADDNGITDAFEIGSGKVLSGLIKRISVNINSRSINEPRDIDNIS